MPRKKKIEVDDNIKQKLDYIGLDLNKVPKSLLEYSDINFRTLKGYDEKKYKQYRFVPVKDIEIILSPTNRLDSIKEKYEKAMPLCYYIDSQNEDNIIKFTTFMNMLKKVTINQIEKVAVEQDRLSKSLPFKVKFTGNYLWQIYYSSVSNKYFMIVPTQDYDYSTFFYLLKKKIENQDEKIFVPISCVDYEGNILTQEEISDIENYLWLFTKDYPLIYEVFNKKDVPSLNIIGETEIYDKIKTLYKVKLANAKDAIKFYKLVKALFILQTELPKYYKFETNINKDGSIEFYLNNVEIKYENLPEFIMEQYLKSVSLKNKLSIDLEDYKVKLDNLKKESDALEKDYVSKEKQITTFLECKKTFFGKVKYFFKYSKKTKVTPKEKIEKQVEKKEEKRFKKEEFKLEKKNYTLSELEQSYKELEVKEEEAKKMVMDINALKLKNKNLKKKIENASNFIEEINKHKRSIFEFWKYSNKDAVATLDEGEEEEYNVTKLEKLFNYEDDFEKFGKEQDKFQRNKFTDDELDSSYIASTELLEIINKMIQNVAENKEISEVLKKLKQTKEEDDELDENFDIFGKIISKSSKERTIGNKIHREQPRDKYEILEIKKGSKGIELKRNLEKVIKELKVALRKSVLNEDMYVYKASSYELDFNSLETFSMDSEDELNQFLKLDRIRNKIFLYKIKIPKDTNFIAFSNIIFYNNKNMTLPVGMDLSKKILIDLNELNLQNTNTKNLNMLQFADEENDFSKAGIKHIEVIEMTE